MKTCLQLLLLLWLGLCQSASAQAPASCAGSYRVAFFNGINTSILEAGESVLRLRDEFGDSYKLQPLRYSRFYNPSEKVLADLGESFTQAAKEHPELAGRWELISLIVNGVSKYDDRFVTLDRSSSAVKALVDRFSAVIAAAQPEQVYPEHLAKFNQYLDSREKIVSVAHSQGNWFMNELAKSVEPRLVPGRETSLYTHVATFTTRLSGPYSNNKNDLALSAGMQTVPGMQTWNVDAGVVLADLLGHSFINIYMNKSLTAPGRPYPRVKGLIQQALDTVAEYPCLSITPANQTIIRGNTVTLIAHSTAPDGTALALPSGLLWSSSNTDVATVSQSGAVTGVRLGTTTIRVTDPATQLSASTSVSVAVGSGLPVRPLWELIGPMAAKGNCFDLYNGVSLRPRDYRFTQSGLAQIDDATSYCRNGEGSSYQFVPNPDNRLQFTYSTLNPPASLVVVDYPHPTAQVGYRLLFNAGNLGKTADMVLMKARVAEYLSPFHNRNCSLVNSQNNGLGRARIFVAETGLFLTIGNTTYFLNLGAMFAGWSGYKEWVFGDTNNLYIYANGNTATPELFVQVVPPAANNPAYPYIGGEIAARLLNPSAQVTSLRCLIDRWQF